MSRGPNPSADKIAEKKAALTKRRAEAQAFLKKKADEARLLAAKAEAAAKSTISGKKSRAQHDDLKQPEKKEALKVHTVTATKDGEVLWDKIKPEELKQMAKELGFKDPSMMKKTLMKSDLSEDEIKAKFFEHANDDPEWKKKLDEGREDEIKLKQGCSRTEVGKLGVGGTTKSVYTYQFDSKDTADQFKKDVGAKACYPEDYKKHQDELAKKTDDKKSDTPKPEPSIRPEERKSEKADKAATADDSAKKTKTATPKPGQ